MVYPRIRLTGTAYERGHTYGEFAAARIHASLAAYVQVFDQYAGLSWSEVRGMAKRYEAPTRELEESLIEEVRGIADGAQRDYLDILAINCRTEIMFAGMARKAARGEAVGAVPAECTAFAALPGRTAAHEVLIGQNWDWLSFADETLVVLEVQQADKPNFITVVEAGLLAKFGMNSRGLGLVTNALVSDADVGEAGVPYHMLLRRILDCESVAEATEVLSRVPRASSANYLIASAEGLAVNAECSPGQGEDLVAIFPDAGYLAHTNHFIAPDFGRTDILLGKQEDTLFRLQSISGGLEAAEGVSVESIHEGLSSHKDFPFSVCTHLPDGGDPLLDPTTVVSAVMNLSACRMWIAHGKPCERTFVEMDLDFLTAAV